MAPVRAFDMLISGPSVSERVLRDYIREELDNPHMGLEQSALSISPTNEDPEYLNIHVHFDPFESSSPEDVERDSIRGPRLICGILAAVASSCRYDVVSMIPGIPLTTAVLKIRRNDPFS